MYFVILTAPLAFIFTASPTSRPPRKLPARLVRWLENSPKHSSPSGLSAGLLAFPTLTCSAAYALAETFDWNHGLNQRFAVARRFYFVIILSTLIGIILDFADVNPMKALFWAALFNGLLAPFLLVGILMIAGDRMIMNDHGSSRLCRSVVGLTASLMVGAAIGFVF